MGLSGREKRQGRKEGVWRKIEKKGGEVPTRKTGGTSRGREIRLGEDRTQEGKEKN